MNHARICRRRTRPATEGVLAYFSSHGLSWRIWLGPPQPFQRLDHRPVDRGPIHLPVLSIHDYVVQCQIDGDEREELRVWDERRDTFPYVLREDEVHGGKSRGFKSLKLPVGAESPGRLDSSGVQLQGDSRSKHCPAARQRDSPGRLRLPVTLVQWRAAAKAALSPANLESIVLEYIVLHSSSLPYGRLRCENSRRRLTKSPKISNCRNTSCRSWNVVKPLPMPAKRYPRCNRRITTPDLVRDFPLMPSFRSSVLSPIPTLLLNICNAWNDIAVSTTALWTSIFIIFLCSGSFRNVRASFARSDIREYARTPDDELRSAMRGRRPQSARKR